MGFIYDMKNKKIKDICKKPLSQHPVWVTVWTVVPGSMFKKHPQIIQLIKERNDKYNGEMAPCHAAIKENRQKGNVLFHGSLEHGDQ